MFTGLLLVMGRPFPVTGALPLAPLTVLYPPLPPEAGGLPLLLTGALPLAPFTMPMPPLPPELRAGGIETRVPEGATLELGIRESAGPPAVPATLFRPFADIVSPSASIAERLPRIVPELVARGEFFAEGGGITNTSGPMGLGIVFLFGSLDFSCSTEGPVTLSKGVGR